MGREDEPGGYGQCDGATGISIRLPTSIGVDSHGTTDDKDELVWIDASLGVTEAVSQQTAQDGSQTIGRVPYADHQLELIKQPVLTYLFLRGCSRLVHHMDTMTTDRQLPSPLEEDWRTHRRTDGSFESSEDEAKYGKPGKRGECRHDAQTGSPAKELICQS